ncbi:hypothetical protein KJ359_011001 [Pestalotiopsis sp. 9143b]|nr:hypothetical protein KJ359_011001 [Pestalotiopsis sp. 9143b]
MPTPIDNALRSKNAVLGFAGIVTAAAAWAIWGTDMFPAATDPTGNPEGWTREEMRRWLAAVSAHHADVRSWTVLIGAAKLAPAEW